jgi:hypothetical protein
MLHLLGGRSSRFLLGDDFQYAWLIDDSSSRSVADPLFDDADDGGSHDERLQTLAFRAESGCFFPRHANEQSSY